jgi:hypothetical protein
MAFPLVVGRFTLRVGIITVMSSYHARLVRVRDVFAQSNIWHLRFRLGKKIAYGDICYEGVYLTRPSSGKKTSCVLGVRNVGTLQTLVTLPAGQIENVSRL